MQYWKFALAAVLGCIVVLSSLVIAEGEQGEQDSTTGDITLKVTDNTPQGSILTDGKSMTVYTFTEDEANITNCSDECIKEWPPVLGRNGMPVIVHGVAGRFATIPRDDGTTQVTYESKPLYYYRGDTKPGDTNGHGREGAWFVVKPGKA